MRAAPENAARLEMLRESQRERLTHPGVARPDDERARLHRHEPTGRGDDLGRHGPRLGRLEEAQRALVVRRDGRRGVLERDAQGRRVGAAVLLPTLRGGQKSTRERERASAGLAKAVVEERAAAPTSGKRQRNAARASVPFDKDGSGRRLGTCEESSVSESCRRSRRARIEEQARKARAHAPCERVERLVPRVAALPAQVLARLQESTSQLSVVEVREDGREGRAHLVDEQPALVEERLSRRRRLGRFVAMWTAAAVADRGRRERRVLLRRSVRGRREGGRLLRGRGKAERRGERLRRRGLVVEVALAEAGLGGCAAEGRTRVEGGVNEGTEAGARGGRGRGGTAYRLAPFQKGKDGGGKEGPGEPRGSRGGGANGEDEDEDEAGRGGA